MVAVEDARVHDVLHHKVLVELVACGDRREALRPEGALGVEEERLALAAAEGARQEGADAESEAELRLAGAVLSVELGDRARLEAAAKDGIEL